MSWILSLSFLWIITCGGCADKIRLSSLPQLKKWEIPSMPQKYAMRTGRKFKDIDDFFDKEKKRSSHWSITPELNFREIDFEEDEEKIKLDHNYKAFLEDDEVPRISNEIQNRKIFDDQNSVKKSVADIDKRFSVFKAKKAKVTKDENNISKSPFAEKHKKHDRENESNSEARNVNRNSSFANSLSAVADKGYDGAALTHVNEREKKEKVESIKDVSVKTVNYQAENKHDESKREGFLDSSEGQVSNPFSTADLKSHIHITHTKSLQPRTSKGDTIYRDNISKERNERQIITKRSVEASPRMLHKQQVVPLYGDAVRKARAAINLLQNKRQTLARPASRSDLMKIVSLNGAKPHTQVIGADEHKQLQQKKLQESRNQALRLLKGTGLEHKSLEKNGILGDQNVNQLQNKLHNNIQNKVIASAVQNKQIENHVSPSNIGPMAKLHLSQPTQAASLSQRANIETPQGSKAKDKIKIVPANVARAVAMAMEQLKRDKMWGKVFVHVLPSGKLKVMVQETKKMPDE